MYQSERATMSLRHRRTTEKAGQVIVRLTAVAPTQHADPALADSMRLVVLVGLAARRQRVSCHAVACPVLKADIVMLLG